MVDLICMKFNLDRKLVRATLVVNFPELKDPAFCANCGESMTEYTYSVSILDADLLCEMAAVINKKMENGLSFTDANKIHLQKQIERFTLGARGNITSKLGLIAKVMKKGKDGKPTHDRDAGWSITHRGFDFLHGKPVPKKVKVFRNSIEERFDETVTMAMLYRGDQKKEVEWRKVAGVLEAGHANPKLL